MKVSVIITLKKDVLDPQGKVIQQTLDDMGLDGVDEVRQGKYFEIDIKENDKKKMVFNNFSIEIKKELEPYYIYDLVHHKMSPSISKLLEQPVNMEFEK